jgi:hypothetical protein
VFADVWLADAEGAIVFDLHVQVVFLGWRHCGPNIVVESVLSVPCG